MESQIFLLFPAGIYGMFDDMYRPYHQTRYILVPRAWKSIFTIIKRISKGGPPPTRLSEIDFLRGVASSASLARARAVQKSTIPLFHY